MSRKTAGVSILAALAIAGCEKDIPPCPDVVCNRPSPEESKTRRAAETSISVNVKPFSTLPDGEKRQILEEIAQNLAHTFPVPNTWEGAKRAALEIGESYYEFGAERGKFRKHKGVDIYGYGEVVVAFANGKVTKVGRYVNKFDHGTTILVNHGEIEGYEVQSVYLHVSGVQVQEGDAVIKGAVLAKTGCTGISDKKFRLLKPGSKKCREKAHLHFQLKVGDSYVSPGVFFPEYAPNMVVSGERLSAPATNGLENYVLSRDTRSAAGTFTSASANPAMLYNAGRVYFYSNEPAQWCRAKAYFKQVQQEINGRNIRLRHKAERSIRTLDQRLRARNYNCD